MKIEESRLLKLEDELNGILFMGMPIGSTGVSLLYIELLIGNADWPYKERTLDFLRSVNIKYRGALSSNRQNHEHGYQTKQYKNKGIITFISSRPHLFKMNYLIWKNHQPDELLCFLKDKSILNSFDRGDSPLFWTKNKLPNIDLKKWRNSFNKIEHSIKNVIKSFLTENGLPSFIGRRILNTLMVQTQYLAAFENFLRACQPKFVMVEHDRFSWCSCLVLAAKKLGIPTFTMMHGVVNNQFGYMPMLADYLFCWGERQKTMLEKYGGNPERIIVTGATQLDTSIKTPKEEVRKKLGIEVGKKVVLLATNPVNAKLRYKLVDIFCETIRQNKDLAGIVRLHPSEDISFYDEHIKKYPDILFDKNNHVTYEESFALADVVCIYNSAYGIDAILKGLPVMVIKIDESHLGQAQDLIEHGGFPIALSSSALSEIINNYFFKPGYRSEVECKMKSYGHNYCMDFGSDAANTIISFIKSTINTKTNNTEPSLGRAMFYSEVHPGQTT